MYNMMMIVGKLHINIYYIFMYFLLLNNIGEFIPNDVES